MRRVDVATFPRRPWRIHELLAVLTRATGRIGGVSMRVIARYLSVWRGLTAARERAGRGREPVVGTLGREPVVGTLDREPVVGTLGREAVDPHSLELLDLRPDYVDEFVLTTSAAGDAAEWARAMFEESIDRRSRRLIFETILRMQIAPDRAPGTIAGWQVIAGSEAHVLMAASGPLVQCRLLVRTGAGRVGLTTAMRYRRWAGRLAWAVLSPRHRSLAPWLLRQAAARLAAIESR